MSETWVGGAGTVNVAADWGPTLPGWENGNTLIVGDATIGAGAEVTFTSDFAFDSNNGAVALEISGTGDVLFTAAESTSLGVQQTLQIDAGATLELENISITSSWLTMSGAGTAAIEGGSLTTAGFSLASNQTLVFVDTTYSTSTSIAGSGTIVLAGTDLIALGGANPSDTIVFANVTAGGTQNTLVIPSYATHLTLSNLGYGDVLEVMNNGTVDNVSLVSDGAGGYKLMDGTVTVAGHVSLAPGATPEDFANTGVNYSWNGAAPCFYPGTRLTAVEGEIAVEDVRPGTMLKTAMGEVLPVRWVGWSEVEMRFADPLRSCPIRITAGALADGVPARDLLVSPDHAIFMDEVLVQAGALVNGSSIIREENVPDRFRYYHIELATHELLLAEGCPAESFVDNVDRMHFHNWDAREAPSEAVEEMPLPRAKSTRQVPPAIREAIAARATQRAA